MKTITTQRLCIVGCNTQMPAPVDLTRRFFGISDYKKRASMYSNNPSRDERTKDAIISQAMVGSYAQVNLSYPKVQISKGTLPAASDATAKPDGEGNILFSWVDNSGISTAKANDKLLIVTYFPATKKIIYTLHAATRAGCKALLAANKMKGHTVETYIGFLSNDEKEAGNSVYAGRVEL